MDIDMRTRFILANCKDIWDSEIGASLHRFRYEVFVKELKWTFGFKVRDEREYDEFDNFDTKYILHINERNEVDCCMRFRSTLKPYMIGKYYSNGCQYFPAPSAEHTWEFSRLAASSEFRRNAKGKALALIFAAVLKFGIRENIQFFVSLCPPGVVQKFSGAGWQSIPLGPPIKTPDDISEVIMFPVLKEFLTILEMRNELDVIEEVELLDLKEMQRA